MEFAATANLDPILSRTLIGVSNSGYLAPNRGSRLRFPGLFGAFWGKVWALGAEAWDPIMRVHEP